MQRRAYVRVVQGALECGPPRGVLKAAQVNPVPPALAACLGASLAFMLPVSTPPNAIVFGSGCVPLLKMVRYGVVLDLFGIAAIIVTVHWLLPR